MDTAPLRVVLLASIDATVRDVTALQLACDLERTVIVHFELVSDESGSSVARCLVSDADGLVFSEDVELDHGCMACTVRYGLLPVLARIWAQGRWRRALVALPATAAPDSVAWEIDHAVSTGDLEGVQLARVLTAVDPTTLREDLLGEDLVDERGLALAPGDDRALGAALSVQLDYSDLVVTLDPPDAAADALLEHVLPPDVERASSVAELDAAALFEGVHDVTEGEMRLSPVARTVRCCDERAGVWTIELTTTAGLHPGRLLKEIELLGAGRIRARGCFNLPTRPGTVCVWDGAGGQLSIGDAGHWQTYHPHTHLVISGVDPADRARIQRAFADVVLTAPEQREAAAWAGCPDGLEAWLGEVGTDGQSGEADSEGTSWDDEHPAAA